MSLQLSTLSLLLIFKFLMNCSSYMCPVASSTLFMIFLSSGAIIIGLSTVLIIQDEVTESLCALEVMAVELPDLGLLSSSFRLSGAGLKTFYHSLYFSHQEAHMHYGLNLRSHFMRTFYTPKTLNRSRRCNITPNKRYNQTKWTLAWRPRASDFKFSVYVVLSSGFIKFTCEWEYSCWKAYGDGFLKLV